MTLRRTSPVPTRATVAALALAALAALAPAPAPAAEHRTAYKSGKQSAERGDWDWAVLHFQRAFDLKPDNAEYRVTLQRAKERASYAHFELAKKHLAAANLETAITELQQAVSLNPANQYAYVELEKALAEWKLRQEARDEAAQQFEKMKRSAERLEGEVPKLDPKANIPIRFDLQDKSVDEIFKLIRDVSGINVIFDEQVKRDEKIDFVTDNVTLEEGLDLLMTQQTLAYKVYNDHTILVYPNNQTKQREYEDQIIRTFFLSNADVKDVHGMLRGVIDVRKTAVNEKLNAITILDTEDKIAIAGRLIEAADKAKAELIIDLEILEVNRSKLKSWGIDITTGDAGGITSTIAFDDDEVRLNNLQRLRQLGSYILSPIPSAILSLIKTDSDTRVLSRPQVRVTDGEKVSLHLGDQVPIPNTSFNTSTTTGGNVVPVTSFTYQDVGIQIQLEPRVHHNREITLKLQAEISAVTSTSTAGQPTIGSREVDTVIRLRDGEANLLAGLFQETSTSSLSGVPGLSDIPFIRRIFGSHSNRKAETEIVLTVMPHIIRVPDITVTDLSPMHVGTERDRKLRGRSKTGVGGSPFRSEDEVRIEEPFTALRPGATQNESESLVVPELGSVRSLGEAQGETGASRLPATATASGAPEAEAGEPSPGPPPEAEEPPGASPAEEESAPAGGEPGTAEEPEPPPAPAPSPSGPVVLSLVPSSTDVQVGQELTVEVGIDTAGRPIAHAPYHVLYDATLAQATNVTEGPFLRASGGSVAFIPQIQSGRILVGHSILTPLRSSTGAGVLAIVTFRATAPGRLQLSFASAQPAEPGNELAPVETFGATVGISP